MKRLALLLAIANLAYFAWWQSQSPPSPVSAHSPSLPDGVPGIRLAAQGATSAARSGTSASAAAGTPAAGTGSAPAEAGTGEMAEGAAQGMAAHGSGRETGARSSEPEGAGPDTEEPVPAGRAETAGEVPGRCFRAGPFAQRQEAERLAARLGKRARAVRVQAERAEVVTGYWVYLPAGTLEQAEALEAEVVARGLQDHYLDRQRGLVSMGIYTYRNMAERRRRQLEKLGFHPRLEPRRRRQLRYWIELEFPGEDAPADPASLVAGGLEVREIACAP